jgi:hypothetical protein
LLVACLLSLAVEVGHVDLERSAETQDVSMKGCLEKHVYVNLDGWNEAWDLLSHITRRTRRFPCSDRTQLVDIDNALLRSQSFGSLAISYSRHCPLFSRSTTLLRGELELLTQSPAKYTPAPFENGKDEFIPAAWCVDFALSIWKKDRTETLSLLFFAFLLFSVWLDTRE